MSLKRSLTPRPDPSRPAAAPLPPVAAVVVAKDTGLVSCWNTLRGGPLKKRSLPSLRSGIPCFTRERANFTNSSQVLSVLPPGQEHLHGLEGSGFVGGLEAPHEVIELEAKGLHIHVDACAGSVPGDQSLFGELFEGHSTPSMAKRRPASEAGFPSWSRAAILLRS